MLKMLSIKIYTYTVYASQANLSCQHNDNVLHEKKISYVSDENICWLDPHIAAATADVVLAVENKERASVSAHFDLPWDNRGKF